MITVKQARDNAIRYFKNKYGITQISTLKDCGDRWFIAGASDIVLYGANTCVFVLKDTGEMLAVPNTYEIYDMIDKSPEISESMI